MARRTFEIAVEPRGPAYQELFYRALPWCAELLLVTVPLPDGADPLLPGGRRLVATLEPYLLRASLEREWPGTRLGGDAVGEVRRYRLEPPLLDVVTSVTDGLYGWRPPALPQDIALLRGDGSPFLVTVTEQGWAALELGPDEEAAVRDLDIALRPLWE